MAYVSLARFKSEHPATPGKVVAIKSASILPEFSHQPHDIVKEIRIMFTLGHPNVRSLKNYDAYREITLDLDY